MKKIYLFLGVCILTLSLGSCSQGEKPSGEVVSSGNEQPSGEVVSSGDVLPSNDEQPGDNDLPAGSDDLQQSDDWLNK